MLSEEVVRHVAKLARVALSDAEAQKFSSQIGDVLDYMEILKEVDTDNVGLTSQVTGLSNVKAKDEIAEKTVSREELLNCSELDIDSNQIRVPKVIKK